jgi:hypothetical protein
MLSSVTPSGIIAGTCPFAPLAASSDSKTTTDSPTLS